MASGRCTSAPNGVYYTFNGAGRAIGEGNDMIDMNAEFHPAEPSRVTVFVGAYGSGKSEVSVNYALWLAARGPVSLADLDTVNPFYRSADAQTALTAAGIRLIKPVYANTNIDVPSIGGDVFSLFDDRRRFAVLDIGGEDLGARVVSSLRPRFDPAETAVYMVVNLLRPFTSTPARIAEVAGTLADAAGMPLSGLVDNTNLLESGDRPLLEASLAEVAEAGRLLVLPVVFRSALDSHAPASWGGSMPDGTPLLRMRRTIGYAFS